MNETMIYHRLGRVLWDVAAVENGATAACGLMLATPYLNDEERRFIVDRMRGEEIGHDRVMATWARAWYGPRPKRPLAYGALVQKDVLAAARLDDLGKFAYTFASVHWNEKNTLRGQAWILERFRRFSPAMASDFAQVVGEESEHVAFGRRVLARLERETPNVARVIERFYAYVETVYPVVVNHAHISVYKRLLRGVAFAPQAGGQGRLGRTALAPRLCFTDSLGVARPGAFRDGRAAQHDLGVELGAGRDPHRSEGRGGQEHHRDQHDSTSTAPHHAAVTDGPQG